MENILGCFTIVDKKLEKFISGIRFYSYYKIYSSIRVGYTFLSNEYWGTSTNLQSKKNLCFIIYSDILIKYILRLEKKTFGQERQLKN